MMPKALSPGAAIALRLDTNEIFAHHLTKAQRAILREAKRGHVNAWMQRRRPCKRLENMGLLSKTGLMSYTLTVRGAEVLAVKV